MTENVIRFMNAEASGVILGNRPEAVGSTGTSWSNISKLCLQQHFITFYKAWLGGTFQRPHTFDPAVVFYFSYKWMTEMRSDSWSNTNFSNKNCQTFLRLSFWNSVYTLNISCFQLFKIKTFDNSYLKSLWQFSQINDILKTKPVGCFSLMSMKFTVEK